MRIKKSERLREGTKVVKLGSRPLATVTQEGLRHNEAKVKDALVRYYPKAGTTSTETETIVQGLYGAGAVAVRVQAATLEDVAVLDHKEEEAAPTHAGIREAVLSVASRMQNVDQEALTKRLDEILSEVGQ